jgi:hypothetical protein
VPQGSVLGRVLFQILVSDLFEDLPLEYDALFADDMVIGLEPDEDKLSYCLEIIASRADRLGIDFDAKKTVAMVVRHKARKYVKYPILFKGRVLEYTDSYKYLGIWLDYCLSFGLAIKVKSSETRKRTNLINRLSHCNAAKRLLVMLKASCFTDSSRFGLISPSYGRIKLSQFLKQELV